MHRLPAMILILFSASVVAADPFSLPETARQISRDDSGKTWRMNGMMPCGFNTARKQLCDSVSKSGFRKKHEIILDPKEQKLLIAWEKGKETLIMMIWREDKMKTCFAWGVSSE